MMNTILSRSLRRGLSLLLSVLVAAGGSLTLGVRQAQAAGEEILIFDLIRGGQIIRITLQIGPALAGELAAGTTTVGEVLPGLLASQTQVTGTVVGTASAGLEGQVVGAALVNEAEAAALTTPARGAFLSLSGCAHVLLVGIIIIEVAIVIYLTIQLIDATIDYYNAQAQAAALDAQIEALHGRLAAQYPRSCCCYNTDPSIAANDPAKWLNEALDEWSCRARSGGGTTYRPLHCYDGFPTNQAQAAGVAAACAGLH